MLNDARVASTWLYVRTCQRVKNIKNIASIRDFQVYIRVNSTISNYYYIEKTIYSHPLVMLCRPGASRVGASCRFAAEPLHD